MRQQHDLVQGSPEWHQFRLEHFGASEAAAMLGISTHTKRTELLHMKHTGDAKVFSDWVQKNVLDNGHAVEALARPIAESFITDELYPATFSLGSLSVSCDGLTMDGKTAFEHKQWNKDLAQSVYREVLPDEYQPQCQQALLVTGAERLLFMVSNGTEDSCQWMWVYPDGAWRKRIQQGWAQFAEDLAAYQPPLDAPTPVATTIEALPALMIRVEGKVLATNLDAFKEKAIGFIEKIKTDLQTDQDFADADSMGKFLKDGEERLALAKDQALAQTASIDELFRAIDFISGEMRVKRLTLEKLVMKRKADIRYEIQDEAKAALVAYVADKNLLLGKPYMPAIASDFAGVMHGKRTVASLRDAAGTELARCKIAANEYADRIQTNLNTLRDLAADYKFLFADAASIVLKGDDDLTALVRLRIAEHKEEEHRKAVAADLERVAAAQTAAPAIPQGGAGGQPGSPQEPMVTARSMNDGWWPQPSPTVAGSPPQPATGGILPPGCTFSPERGIRQVGPHGGVIGAMPNPTHADLTDPIFKAIGNATNTWDVNVPEHYVGYCGMNGSHVMLILNAIRAIKPAGKKTSKKKGR